MSLKFTEEQLNQLDKSFIVELFLQLQTQNDKLSAEIQSLNRKMELLVEQMTLANKNRFDRSTEQMTDANQIRFVEVDGTIVLFNEAELAKTLEISRNSAYNLLKRGDIKCFKIGTHYKIPSNAVNEYIERMTGLPIPHQ